MKIKGIKLARAKLLAQKHSPELLMAGGIVCAVGAVAWAAKASWADGPRVWKNYKFTTEQLKRAENWSPTEEEEKDFAQFQTMAAVEMVMGMAKVYGPAVVLLAMSIGMFAGSNRILNKRYVGVLGAYKLVDEGFKKYRQRVIDELGPETDHYFRYLKKSDKDLSIVETKGKKEFKPHEEQADLPGEIEDLEVGSIYARWFDNHSVQWRNDQSLNLYFLSAQQNFMNDMLHLNGHLFLNEVYDVLGIPRSKEGALVGWVEGHGDSFVDFGIFDPTNKKFINRYTDEGILLDFNVDGIIWDLI